jgi:hypothetical protein
MSFKAGALRKGTILPGLHQENQNNAIYTYVYRIVNYKQMDFETTLDQLRMLASGNALQVYKSSCYRKQMRDQWARDDPAFAVTQVAFLLTAALMYGVVFAFKAHSFDISGIAWLVYRVVVVDWLLFGVVVATLGQFFANNFLRNFAASESVEWLFAFDIHCNAFVPRFVLLYLVHFFFLSVLNPKSGIYVFLTNALYVAGFGVYFYVTHQGYRTLPFLKGTEVFLYPIAALAILFVVSLFAVPFGVNMNVAWWCGSSHLG